MPYHINPESGKPGTCTAKPGNCRFKVAPEAHFSTKNEAVEHWAAAQNLDVIKTHKKIILSDIDGTLVRGSLVLTNAIELHDSGEIDLGDTPARWLADKKNEALIVELAEKYRYALAGRTVAFVRAENTVQRLMASDASFYKTLATLVEHKKQGHEVVLISGSPSFLVKPFAEKFGFKFHASEYHVDSDGKFTGEISLMAGAAAKRAVVKDLNITEYDEVVGLGDTASDAPLMEFSHRNTLVDPTEETIAFFKEQGIIVHEIIHD